MTSRFRQRTAEWVESPAVQNFIITLIIINAITLGLETSSTIMRVADPALEWLEKGILAIFIAEIALKLYAHGWRFFRQGWNVFDFSIVAIALVPAAGPFAILRSLRILRVLRLLTRIDRLRRIIESLLQAIPSIGWILFLLTMVFYIFCVMGTQLFSEEFPERFGNLGLTLYSLFQVMTLESWSEGISRPVMEVFPYAWIYFTTFVLITAFVVLNLFIGIIVSTMQEQHYEEENRRRNENEATAHQEREEMLLILRDLDKRVRELQKPPNTDASAVKNTPASE